MKAYKEWFNDFDCVTIDCGGIGCNTLCNQIREETWRATLEWVLTHELIDDDGRFIESHIIKEELEDETDK